MIEDKIKCDICNKEIDYSESYEYRGAISCDECFDVMTESRDKQRQSIIDDYERKSKRFKGFDIDPDSIIGKANREIFKKDIEIYSKETKALKDYERR